MENSTELVPTGNGTEELHSKQLCDLTQGFSFILQTILGVLAFSTLILKRYREPSEYRRPFWIWFADTTKQGLGMLEIHFLNLGLSAIVVEKECIIYLVSFLLDSTIGLLVIFILLKFVALLVHCFKWTPLKSGEYGTPFKFHYWLAQCGVYLGVMFVEKLIVGPLIIFDFWNKAEHLLPSNEKLRIAIVIFIVPFVVNVLMFWIVDSLLMRKQGGKSGKRFGKGCCQNSNAKYGKLQTKGDTDSCTDSDECDTLYTNIESSDIITDQPQRSKKERPGHSINMHTLPSKHHR